MSQEFENKVLDLVKQKGFYPYEDMSDFEKFLEELPSKENFYSSLTDRKNSDKEYEQVFNIWTIFEMKKIKDYHDLFLKCEVLLLADVVEKLRNNRLKNYGLCPSYYFTASLLSWDSMLKMTKIEHELIPDPDMYIFFEKGTRGGISYISNRCSIINNKYIRSYDVKEESKHIIYLDANSSYSYVMSKFLPKSGFKWIDPKKFDLNRYTSNSSKGCVHEDDLEFPE